MTQTEIKVIYPCYVMRMLVEKSCFVFSLVFTRLRKA